MTPPRQLLHSVRSFACAALAAVVLPHAADGQRQPTQDYLVYVASESSDRITLVRFGPGGSRIDHDIQTGIMPADVDGPHGLALSPDKRFYYVTTAHGTPFGMLWKYTTDRDSLVATVPLGMFPATMQVSPDGEFVYVVNFNLHGDMVPSSVSVVAAGAMVEVARIRTCTMPHGSRINAQGTRQYSACMMDDMAVEIDTRTFAVSRHFMLAAGKEHGETGPPHGAMAAGGLPGAQGGAHQTGSHHAREVSCSPTWAQPSPDGARLYVACNKSNDIVELDVAGWKLVRRIPAGDGVYNLGTTSDGRLLIATNKRGQSVSVFDTKSGKELARIPTKRKVVHGVAISPDDRYAFISVEGVGAEPGTVEIIDLQALQTVARVDVGQQAGGIDFFKVEAAK